MPFHVFGQASSTTVTSLLAGGIVAAVGAVGAAGAAVIGRRKPKVDDADYAEKMVSTSMELIDQLRGELKTERKAREHLQRQVDSLQRFLGDMGLTAPEVD